jgi:3-oxoacyl-[acyl-carrier protein] reductase
MAGIDSIEIGATAQLTRTITATEIAAFAALSGDYNPLHVDPEFARQTSFQKPVAHGMLLASYVSSLVGMTLPGAGALWARQEYRWPAAVFAGDTICICLTVTQKSPGSKALSIGVKAVNQEGRVVMDGDGVVVMVDRHERVVPRRLRDRVVFVSGAAGGIGAAVARAMAEAGAAVGVNYFTHEERANAICRSIEQAGGCAVPLQADVRDRSAVVDALAQMRSRFGRPVDVLVNNAAAPPVIRPFHEMSWNDIQATLDVQLQGAFHCCQAALPGMVAQKSGRIVNIGSAMARGVPAPHWSAFTVSKSALHALTRSLAVEFGPLGIQVNTVSPGTTETESTAAIPERLRKVQAMQTPLRRLGAAEDVAAAVLFLCSEAGEYITGADLPVCGGWSM